MCADLLTIAIQKNEEELITADSLNHAIKASSAPAILIRPDAWSDELPLQTALHLLRHKTAPQMIIFSDNSWPLLFTRDAWIALQGIPNEGCGAKALTSKFVAHARQMRCIPILQLFK